MLDMNFLPILIISIFGSSSNFMLSRVEPKKMFYNLVTRALGSYGLILLMASGIHSHQPLTSHLNALTNRLFSCLLFKHILLCFYVIFNLIIMCLNIIRFSI